MGGARGTELRSSPDARVTINRLVSPMRSRVSRRDVLKVVAITGTAVPIVIGSAGRADADSGTTVLVGTVESAGTDGVVVRTPSETVKVLAAEGARMYSGADGEVTSTAEFHVGDRVGVEGTRTPQGLLATAVGSVFTPIEAQVTGLSADGSVADTSAGPILLTAGRLPGTAEQRRRQRAAGVGPGTVIRGLGWTHPGTGQRYLLVRG